LWRGGARTAARCCDFDGSRDARERPVEHERRAIRVRGVVQGVGFRPAMYRLADGLRLTGFVQNDREGVWIEVEGPHAAVERFVGELAGAAPPASRIDRMEAHPIATVGDHGFRIAGSPDAELGPRATAEIPVDLAPCDACLREIDDPHDRRYRYPFTNCTACGPRFTIVRDVPYDRRATTMAAFAMCDACRREYADPGDRRFHAEPNACPACGPRVRLATPREPVAEGDAAIRAAAAKIADGGIVAIKGAGGFVLAVDATNDRAIVRLRERKRRPHKPFAVMARSLADAERAGVLDDAARALLASPQRPIVLVPTTGAVARAVAPGLADVGLYLPPTPLQHLLLVDGPPLQVMTSGNLSEEPIARTDDEAFAKLGAIADAFLIHDREVWSRADDSVVRSARRGAIPIRRARGSVPDAIALPIAGPTVLAVGGHERNTVCLVHAGRAIVSQHVGDLDHPDSDALFREVIDRLERLAGARPAFVAHDFHPDYRSTTWARACGLERIAIQHHHAHVAACLAEHGRDDRVVGVAFDGTGLGTDGTLWGGEILDGGLLAMRRRGHLRPIALAGGEAAIRQPWRLAAAALIDAGEPLDLLPRVSASSRALVAGLIATTIPPRATGAGRWFDAVAALLGVSAETSYDGQAAAQLEAIAAPDDVSPFELAVSSGDPFEIDLRPAVRELAHAIRRGAPTPILAARFHATLVAAIREACGRADRRTVALTGGCFQNRMLLERTRARLEADGFEVLVHHKVPPNDGGLSLGQAAIASARLAGGTACA
jgi:hydrogenase maturation protein HypF